MKNGTCPKCQGKEIYTDEGLPKRGDRTSIAISSWHKLFIATYICKGCGYIEEFVEDEYLMDEKKMDKLQDNWKKL